MSIGLVTNLKEWKNPGRSSDSIGIWSNEMHKNNYRVETYSW